MSHLARIIDLKEALVAKDYTTDQQTVIVQTAYVVALTRINLLRRSGTLHVSESFVEDMWKTLDMWNKVSPVKGGVIVQRVNNVFKDLYKNLVSQSSFIFNFFDQSTGVAFEPEQFPAFEDLVQTLIKEFEDYIYNGKHD